MSARPGQARHDDKAASVGAVRVARPDFRVTVTARVDSSHGLEDSSEIQVSVLLRGTRPGFRATGYKHSAPPAGGRSFSGRRTCQLAKVCQKTGGHFGAMPLMGARCHQRAGRRPGRVAPTACERASAPSGRQSPLASALDCDRCPLPTTIDGRPKVATPVQILHPCHCTYR